MNVLSLFDGCGMLRPALDKANINVENYYSSEIDKYASQIANKNYPDTQQIGDVTKWREWDLPKIDLLTAGFPCQDLSCAGKQEGLNGERSGLLYEVLKIRDALKPQYFLFENVASMSHHWKDEITRLVGVNPVELNSKYWGAQNRARLFWTNIPGAKNIEMMQVQNDKKIYLKDILIDGAVDKSNGCKETPLCLGNVNPSGRGMNGNVFSSSAKSPTLKTNKGEGIKIGITQEEYEALFIKTDKKLKILKDDFVSDEINKVAQLQGGVMSGRIVGKNGKSVTLTVPSGGANGGCTGLVFAILQKGHGYNKGKVFDTGKTPTLTSNSWEYNNHLLSERGIRKLCPIECERLMNLPDGYTEGVSNAQRYKMLGNGWDPYVIADLLRGIKEEVIDIQPSLFAEAL